MITELEKSKLEADKAKGKGRVKKILSLIEKNLPSAAKEASAKPKSAIAVDFPVDGEKMQPLHYAVRIQAQGGDAVEISIDGGDWQGCRQTEGYFWHDWHSIPKGKHKVSARMRLPNGKFKKSPVVRCTVE